MILVRNGINSVSVKQSPILPGDDNTEWCAERVFTRASYPSSQPASLDLYNLYRPPFRTTETDLRVDRFDPTAYPTSDRALILVDINAHYPSWDATCLDPDEVGCKVHDLVA